MARFIVRRLGLVFLTMLMVSIAIFLIIEAAPGNVARNVLGVHITPEQEASFLAQLGLDKPFYLRYLYWLIGSDWHAESKIGMPVRRITMSNGFTEWWAVEAEESFVRWKFEGGDLIAQYLLADGSTREIVENFRWRITDRRGEAARLQAYRQQVAANDRLADDVRHSILEALEHMVILLEQDDLSQEELAAGLSEPESTIAQNLIQPSRLQKIEAGFQNATAEMMKDDLLSTLVVLETLANPDANTTIPPNELQKMGQTLTQAAEKVQETAPRLAQRLSRVRTLLDEDRVGEIGEGSTEAVSELEEFVGPMADFFRNLKNGLYIEAAIALERLSRPGSTFWLEHRFLFWTQALDAMGRALEGADSELGQAVREATGELKEGNQPSAQAALREAAEIMMALGRTVEAHRVAQQAQVSREFWGVDTHDHAVLWEKTSQREVWSFIVGTGWQRSTGGPAEYIPLQKGLLRGDPGVSLRTGRPVAATIFTRLRNSLVLAGIAFMIVMPLALFLGLLAGLNEGKLVDRALSVGGLVFTATPEFATGIFLILIFASWLKIVPGATVFGERSPWERVDMLILPVLTLTLIELGYVLRITRASIVEVMRAPYIRTAFLKGLSYRHIILQHALRNALMAPITIIMLHVNWLLGGIVIVESIFGYPGLGKYLLDAALFKDTNSIEAGAMILVTVAVGTQLIADIIYTFLNPRIRYT